MVRIVADGNRKMYVIALIVDIIIGEKSYEFEGK